MNVFLGIISPFGIILLVVLYSILSLISLYFIIRNEKSLFLFFWIVLVLFVPVIGATIYLCKHFFEKKKSVLAQ